MDINRSTMYYKPVPNTEELELKRRMDKLHMKHPFMGSISLRNQI